MTNTSSQAQKLQGDIYKVSMIIVKYNLLNSIDLTIHFVIPFSRLGHR